MPIANYTTEVPAHRSVGEIQGMLVKKGATHISVEYIAQQPVGLTFLIATKHGEMLFKLPANIAAVKRVLEKQHVRACVDDDKASRVGWRIIRDWVRAQLAFIETEMVSLDEVMLPYLIVGGAVEKTLYQSMEEKHLQLSEKAEQ